MAKRRKVSEMSREQFLHHERSQGHRNGLKKGKLIGLEIARQAIEEKLREYNK
jgi:hypothetical protein